MKRDEETLVLTRPLVGGLFEGRLNGIDIPIVDLEAYKEVLNSFFCRGEEGLRLLAEFSGQALTYRTFTLFSFLQDDGIGRMNRFLTRLSSTKYRVKERALFDYLFASDPVSIVELEKKFFDLRGERSRIEAEIALGQQYVDAANEALVRLGISVKFTGDNGPDICTLIGAAGTAVEPTLPKKGDLAKCMQDACSLRDEIRSQETMLGDLDRVSAQNRKREALLEQLSSIISSDSRYEDLLSATVSVLEGLRGSASLRDIRLQKEMMDKKKALLSRLEEEIVSAGASIDPFDIDERRRAAILAMEYVSSYPAVGRAGELEEIKKQIAETRRELSDRRRMDDVAAIDVVSDDITWLYSVGKNKSPFVRHDFSLTGFSVKYIKEGTSLQPVFEDGHGEVDLYTGSRARHALMQACGYLALMLFLERRSDCPVVPMIAVDHLSGPFDEESRRAIGAVFQAFYSRVSKKTIQLFLFEPIAPEELGITPDCHIVLGANGQSGFNPFWHDSDRMDG